MILYTKDKSTYFDIQNHLKEVSPTFYPPLSERVNIDDYAQKIRKFGVTFEAWIDNCLIGLVACYVNDIIRKYVAKYPHLIKPVYQVENQYSKGVKIMSTYNYSRARGKYIALCEGDDYWIDPLKLQKQIDVLESDSSIGLVYTDFYVYDENEKRMTSFPLKVKNGDGFSECLKGFIHYSSMPPYYNLFKQIDLHFLPVISLKYFTRYCVFKMCQIPYFFKLLNKMALKK